MTTKAVTIYDEEENEIEVKAPARWEICSRCNGDGKHSNPAIDGNGLTAEDFEDDPDFRADYMSGRYDIPCENSCSSGKVLVIDEERFALQDPKSYALWKEQESSDEAYRYLCDSETRWERRMLYGSDY